MISRPPDTWTPAYGSQEQYAEDTLAWAQHMRTTPHAYVLCYQCINCVKCFECGLPERAAIHHSDDMPEEETLADA
jgi:hypothetical protein